MTLCRILGQKNWIPSLSDGMHTQIIPTYISIKDQSEVSRKSSDRLIRRSYIRREGSGITSEVCRFCKVD